jgi:hypothetical protein
MSECGPNSTEKLICVVDTSGFLQYKILYLNITRMTQVLPTIKRTATIGTLL